MSRIVRSCMLASILVLMACSHTKPNEMTVENHEKEVVRHDQLAQDLDKKYDPSATKAVIIPPGVYEESRMHGPTEQYNPTDTYHFQALRHWQRANEHREAAETLRKLEASACAGIPKEARGSCPLIRPNVAFVEDLPTGLRLTLREDTNRDDWFHRMECHRAYALAFGEIYIDCPLFVKDVIIRKQGERAVEFVVNNSEDVVRLKNQGRALFLVKAKTQ